MSASKHYSRCACLLLMILAVVKTAPCHAVDEFVPPGRSLFDTSYEQLRKNSASGSKILTDEIDLTSGGTMTLLTDSLDNVDADAGLSMFAEEETFNLMSSLTSDDLEKSSKTAAPDLEITGAGGGSSGRRKRAHPMTTVLIYCSIFGGFALFLMAAREVDGYLNYRRYREWQSPRYPFVIEDRPESAWVRTRTKRKTNTYFDFLAYLCGSRFDSGLKKKLSPRQH